MKSLFGLVIVAVALSAQIAAAENGPPALPADSIYQLDSHWTDQDGKPIRLADLSGKPVVLSLVYLSCKYTCPTVITEMQEINGKLSAESRNSVRFVLVSIDPSKDTPEATKAYRSRRKLDPNHWTFLTAKTENDVRELAVVLNFKYQKIKSGDFTHSFMIFALDKSGVVKAQVDRANQDKTPIVDALK